LRCTSILVEIALIRDPLFVIRKKIPTQASLKKFVTDLGYKPGKDKEKLSDEKYFEVKRKEGSKTYY